MGHGIQLGYMYMPFSGRKNTDHFIYHKMMKYRYDAGVVWCLPKWQFP